MESVKLKKIVKRIFNIFISALFAIGVLGIIFVVGFKFWWGDYQLKYNTKWITGKTYAEITDKYGEFDFTYTTTYVNGISCITKAAYVTRENTSVDLLIEFNEEGKACKVRTSYDYDTGTPNRRNGIGWNNQVYIDRYNK